MPYAGKRPRAGASGLAASAVEQDMSALKDGSRSRRSQRFRLALGCLADIKRYASPECDASYLGLHSSRKTIKIPICRRQTINIPAMAGASLDTYESNN